MFIVFDRAVSQTNRKQHITPKKQKSAVSAVPKASYIELYEIIFRS